MVTYHVSFLTIPDYEADRLMKARTVVGVTRARCFLRVRSRFTAEYAYESDYAADIFHYASLIRGTRYLRTRGVVVLSVINFYDARQWLTLSTLNSFLIDPLARFRWWNMEQTFNIPFRAAYRLIERNERHARVCAVVSFVKRVHCW